MEITNNANMHIENISDIAYQKYCREIENHSFLETMSKSIFFEFLKKKTDFTNCIIGIENDKCVGFILYSLRDDGNEVYCNIPVWGYGSNNEKPEKTIGHLFQNLAEQTVLDKKTNFSVRLYAHDNEIQKLFSYMQFGITSEKAIRYIVKIDHTSMANVREIPKHELARRWHEVWELLMQLIDHLKKSPVFYPCIEFTEDLYKGFFADTETKVYIAEDGNKIIGLIESNSENLDLWFSNENAVNVGEAYVLPEYRGHQVAQALLNYSESIMLDKHIKSDWVEHGTANPTARGFWNKYFQTVEYEFFRTVMR